MTSDPVMTLSEIKEQTAKLEKKYNLQMEHRFGSEIMTSFVKTLRSKKTITKQRPYLIEEFRKSLDVFAMYVYTIVDEMIDVTEYSRLETAIIKLDIVLKDEIARAKKWFTMELVTADATSESLKKYERLILQQIEELAFVQFNVLVNYMIRSLDSKTDSLVDLILTEPTTEFVRVASKFPMFKRAIELIEHRSSARSSSSSSSSSRPKDEIKEIVNKMLKLFELDVDDSDTTTVRLDAIAEHINAGKFEETHASVKTEIKETFKLYRDANLDQNDVMIQIMILVLGRLNIKWHALVDDIHYARDFDASKLFGPVQKRPTPKKTEPKRDAIAEQNTDMIARHKAEMKKLTDGLDVENAQIKTVKQRIKVIEQELDELKIDDPIESPDEKLSRLKENLANTNIYTIGTNVYRMYKDLNALKLKNNALIEEYTKKMKKEIADAERKYDDERKMEITTINEFDRIQKDITELQTQIAVASVVASPKPDVSKLWTVEAYKRQLNKITSLAIESANIDDKLRELDNISDVVMKYVDYDSSDFVVLVNDFKKISSVGMNELKNAYNIMKSREEYLSYILNDEPEKMTEVMKNWLHLSSLQDLLKFIDRDTEFKQSIVRVFPHLKVNQGFIKLKTYLRHAVRAWAHSVRIDDPAKQWAFLTEFRINFLEWFIAKKYADDQESGSVEKDNVDKLVSAYKSIAVSQIATFESDNEEDSQLLKFVDSIIEKSETQNHIDLIKDDTIFEHDYKDDLVGKARWKSYEHLTLKPIRPISDEESSKVVEVEDSPGVSDSESTKIVPVPVAVEKPAEDVAVIPNAEEYKQLIDAISNLTIPTADIGQKISTIAPLHDLQVGFDVLRHKDKYVAIAREIGDGYKAAISIMGDERFEEPYKIMFDLKRHIRSIIQGDPVLLSTVMRNKPFLKNLQRLLQIITAFDSVLEEYVSTFSLFGDKSNVVKMKTYLRHAVYEWARSARQVKIKGKSFANEVAIVEDKKWMHVTEFRINLLEIRIGKKYQKSLDEHSDEIADLMRERGTIDRVQHENLINADTDLKYVIERSVYRYKNDKVFVDLINDPTIFNEIDSGILVYKLKTDTYDAVVGSKQIESLDVKLKSRLQDATKLSDKGGMGFEKRTTLRGFSDDECEDEIEPDSDECEDEVEPDSDEEPDKPLIRSSDSDSDSDSDSGSGSDKHVDVIRSSDRDPAPDPDPDPDPISDPYSDSEYETTYTKGDVVWIDARFMNSAEPILNTQAVLKGTGPNSFGRLWKALKSLSEDVATDKRYDENLDFVKMAKAITAVATLSNEDFRIVYDIMQFEDGAHPSHKRIRLLLNNLKADEPIKPELAGVKTLILLKTLLKIVTRTDEILDGFVVMFNLDKRMRKVLNHFRRAVLTWTRTAHKSSDVGKLAPPKLRWMNVTEYRINVLEYEILMRRMRKAVDDEVETQNIEALKIYRGGEIKAQHDAVASSTPVTYNIMKGIFNDIVKSSKENSYVDLVNDPTVLTAKFNAKLTEEFVHTTYEKLFDLEALPVPEPERVWDSESYYSLANPILKTLLPNEELGEPWDKLTAVSKIISTDKKYDDSSKFVATAKAVSDVAKLDYFGFQTAYAIIKADDGSILRLVSTLKNRVRPGEDIAFSSKESLQQMQTLLRIVTKTDEIRDGFVTMFGFSEKMVMLRNYFRKNVWEWTKDERDNELAPSSERIRWKNITEHRINILQLRIFKHDLEKDAGLEFITSVFIKTLEQRMVDQLAKLSTVLSPYSDVLNMFTTFTLLGERNVYVDLVNDESVFVEDYNEGKKSLFANTMFEKVLDLVVSKPEKIAKPKGLPKPVEVEESPEESIARTNAEISETFDSFKNFKDKSYPGQIGKKWNALVRMSEKVDADKSSYAERSVEIAALVSSMHASTRNDVHMANQDGSTIKFDGKIFFDLYSSIKTNLPMFKDMMFYIVVSPDGTRVAHRKLLTRTATSLNDVQSLLRVVTEFGIRGAVSTLFAPLFGKDRFKTLEDSFRYAVRDLTLTSYNSPDHEWHRVTRYRIDRLEREIMRFYLNGLADEGRKEDVRIRIREFDNQQKVLDKRSKEDTLEMVHQFDILDGKYIDLIRDKTLFNPNAMKTVAETSSERYEVLFQFGPILPRYIRKEQQKKIIFDEIRRHQTAKNLEKGGVVIKGKYSSAFEMAFDSGWSGDEDDERDSSDSYDSEFESDEDEDKDEY